MAVELYDAVNGDGLFQIQGKGFFAIDTLNTMRLTTLPQEVKDFISQFRKITAVDLSLEDAMIGASGIAAQWSALGQIFAGQIRQNCESLLVQLVRQDSLQPDQTLERSVKYIIDQMILADQYVDPNTVGSSLVTGAANVGDTAIAHSVKRGDGRSQENALAETLKLTALDFGQSPSIELLGQEAQADQLSEQWPKGSGVATSLSPTDPANTLLPNGTFEDEVDVPNKPDGWTISVGSAGGTVKLTNPEVQTVAISGSPTGGHFYLLFTAAGVQRSTAPLAHNAASTAVQAALRALGQDTGLGAVTVAQSGTSPNLTHTVTFTGTAQNLSELTSINNMTGGTPVITHNTTTQGDDGAYRGKALVFDSDGSQLTAIQAPVTLEPETVYLLHFRLKRIGATVGGTVKAELIQSIGAAAAVNDSQGVANELSISAAGITTGAHSSHFVAFRTPKQITNPLYVRLRITVAIDATANIYFDDAALVEADELYDGGPFVNAFLGKKPGVEGDNWTLTVTNDRAGQLQEWWNRAFNMAGLGLLLPSSGVTNIPDSVIS